MVTSVPESRSDLALCVQLVARWAELIGVLPLYPEGSVRVSGALGRLRSALSAVAGERPLCLRFDGDTLLVADTVLQVKPASKLHWVKERFESSLLAGVCVAGDVAEASLAAFSRRLVENHVRRARPGDDLRSLWPDPIPGLDLEPRRFEGGFDGGLRGLGGGPGRVAGPGADAEPRGALALAPVAPAEGPSTIGRRLVADPAVRRALDELRGSPPGGAPSGEGATSLAALDLLESIVALLPAEAVGDPERATALTLAAIERLASARAAPPAELERHAGRVGYGLFGRADGPGEPPPAPLPRTRRAPGEARLRATPDGPLEAPQDEELLAFERELAALEGGPVPFARAAVDSPSEQLGVYLHELASVADPAELPGLEPGLARLLEQPGEAELAVLRQVLCDAGPLGERGRERVVAALRRRGDTRWIRACGALDAAWAVREFPREFLEFADALPLDEPAGAALLREVCESVGAAAIDAAAPALRGDRRLLAEPFARAVLADRSGALLPLARLVLESGGEAFKEPFLGALGALELDPADRSILALVRRPAWLSVEYLLLVANGSAGTKLDYQRQAVLCRFLRATDDDPALERERVAAVELLAGMPSVQVLRQLKRLVAERRMGGVLPRHPRALREAARAAVKGFVDGPLEWNDV